MAQRRLTDLFVIGRELTLNDGEGEPVVVWLQKLNLVDQTDASRRADSARARVLSLRADKTSEGYLRAVGESYDAASDQTALVEFMASDEQTRIQPQAEARAADEEEWKKDNYLQGLRDAWTGGLADAWTAEPTEESTRVKGELDRYLAQVAELVDDDMGFVRERYAAMPETELRDLVAGKLLDIQGTRAWLEEFYKTQMYYGVRTAENHRGLYFTNREEVDELSSGIFRRLREAYEGLEVDVMEGKGSAAVPPSSDSSVPPGDSATDDSSGLVVVPG